jgi:hypothetical protein
MSQYIRIGYRNNIDVLREGSDASRTWENIDKSIAHACR